MKINIGDIRVKERVRKEVTRIEELAADMADNGLLNPITVMEVSSVEDGGGEFQLLAGLRRLKAAQTLGWSEIPVNVVAPADAEQALRMEISENEQRVEFNFTEKMEFARLLEDIEKAKAKERMMSGKKTSDSDPVPHGAQGQGGKTRDIVADKIGMKRTNYDRAKYIADNASAEIIEEIDNGTRSIRGTYDELRAKAKAEAEPSVQTVPVREQAKEAVTEAFTVKDSSEAVSPAVAPKQATPAVAPKQATPATATKQATPATATMQAPSDTAPKQKPTATAAKQAPPALKSTKPPKSPKLSDKEKSERAMAMFSPKEREAIERNNAFATMTAEEKVVELQRQLKEERSGRAVAESELSRLRDELHNAVMHRDGIISSLNRENERLKVLLVDANAKINELEGNVNVTSA